MVNGREYEWASLIARLDRSNTLQERMTVETLVHNQRVREAIESLPVRIASAISEQQRIAAPAAAASALSGWTDLLKVLGDALNRAAALALLYLVATGRLSDTQLSQLPFMWPR